MKKKHQRYSGFTLIEVLVVITIISLMAITAIISFSQLGKQSRDARRRADVEQIRSALEIYQQNNTYRSYPQDLNTLVNGTVQYLKSLPLDPKTNRTYIVYAKLPAGCDGTTTVCTSYTLTCKLETGGAYQTDPFGGVVITIAPD